MRHFGGLVALAGCLAASHSSAAVKLQIIQGHTIVEGVYVNGHGPYSFLLDTGTTANHIDSRVASSIGLTPTFRSELISSAGTRYVPGTDGIEVVLGDVRAEKQRFLFAGVDVVKDLAPNTQGVLGEAFLSNFDYFLDLRGKQIEFGKREPAPDEIRTSFRLAEARPVVPTSLGELVLDSGTRWVTLFGVKGTRATGELITMSGSLTIGMVARQLLIAGRSFWRGQALAVPRTVEPGAAGLLPVSLFKTVYFCNSERYVSLQ